MVDQTRPIDTPTSSNSRVRQVEAIMNGTVIDHIPGPMTLKVANLLARESDQVSIGMNLRSARMGRKGLVKISGRELDEATLSRLALIAPGASVSIIRDYQVVHKSTVPMPALFEDIARCANPNCRLFFYDASRTRRRRWCSMATCGNRHKVSAFLKRRRRH